MTKEELQEYADSIVRPQGATPIMRAVAQNDTTPMAMAVGMPMIFTIPTGTDFTIKNSDGEVVYSATANRLPNTPRDARIDLAPIFRQLVAPYDWSDIAGATVFSTTGFVYTFTLTTVNGDTTIKAVWDYSHRSNVPLSASVFSEPVQDYLYLRQKMPIGGHNAGSTVMYVRLTFADGTTTDSQLVGVETESFAYMPNPANWRDDLRAIQFVSGTGDDAVPLTPAYPYRDCVPTGTITLYWVNPRGGMTWVHCNRRNTAKTNVTRSQITRDSDPTAPSAFGLDNYNIETYKSYTLNTDFLTAEQSEKLQSLFYAPRVWLYDYADGSTTAVVVTDKSATIKTRENSGAMFNYTINVRESQTYNIVG